MTASSKTSKTSEQSIPGHMQAAIWRGGRNLSVEQVPVPAIKDGEILVQVAACGLCPTDIKKIDLGLVPPPVILGHEFSGRVVSAGPGATHLLGQRVAVYHHIPCRQCRLCDLGLYSQCEGYKITGTTAGFMPAGGGWAEYVRVMPWIVADGGVMVIPEDLALERAILMEPLNTCLKCVKTLPDAAGDLVILGQGPVGLMLTALAVRQGWTVHAVEPVPERLAMASRFGAAQAWHPDEQLLEKLGALGGGLGPDAVIAATESEEAINLALETMRFGGTMVLFAHTRDAQLLSINGGAIGKAEKRLVGSYSSSVDLNGEVLTCLSDPSIPWGELVTHLFPVSVINQALDWARKPREGSLKIAVQF